MALLTVVVPVAPAEFFSVRFSPLARVRLPETVAPSRVPPEEENESAPVLMVPPVMVPP